MRNPVSPEILRAAISLSFAWEWYAFGVCLWLGWHCLLRPGEICDVIKEDPRLAEMVLVKNSRLSVQPVTPEEWRIVCALAGVDP